MQTLKNYHSIANLTGNCFIALKVYYMCIALIKMSL